MKKFLSVFLAVLLVFSAVPLMSFAAGNGVKAETQATNGIASILSQIREFFEKILNFFKKLFGAGKDNTGKDKKTDEEKTVKYSNGDYIYFPEDTEIDYDEKTNTMFTKNLIDVYTYSDLSSENNDKIASAAGGKIVGDISGTVNMLQVKVDAKDFADLNNKINSLYSDSDVMYATYDLPMTYETEADENPWSGETDKGDEANPGGNDWWAESVGAYTAWQSDDKASDIKVGVIDDGFYTSHEDLKDKFEFPADFKTVTVDSFEGYPDFSHGTHVAGLIGANNNNVGIRGVADKAKIEAIDMTSGANNFNLSEGIKTLVDDNCKVINLSLGATVYSEEVYAATIYKNYAGTLLEKLLSDLTGDEYLYYKTHRTAILYAIESQGTYAAYLDSMKLQSERSAVGYIVEIAQMIMAGKDFIITQAAGNGYDNAGPGYDASLTCFFAGINENMFNSLPEQTRKVLAEKGITYDTVKSKIMIVAAAENKKDDSGNYKLADFSNYGDCVDIAAPGVGILSTVNNNGYQTSDGTSMSSPIVAGAAAYLWSLHPEMTSSEIKTALISNAKTAVGVTGKDQGRIYPFLNIGSAVAAAAENK